ncbi:unnamed protein product [Auanema sp. JU1783]|nr:unnamed protein product [Auanema sp. JU1783]
MKFLIVALCGLALAQAVVIRKPEHLSGQALVDYVNQHQSHFKTKLSTRFSGMDKGVKGHIMGALMIEVPAEDRKNEVNHDDIEDATIPDSFDSRTQWPNCPSINNIRDQSSCGSCWAFGAAEAISDRICIASAGKTQVTISADDILSCCGRICGNGCQGGYPIEAWKHYVKAGVVSGGAYGSNVGCKPYPFPPCEHHDNATRYKPCPSDLYPTDQCSHSCESGYSITYDNDKHFGKSAYAVSHKVTDIQKEILTHGPVEVSFTVFEDFEHYSSGIYVHTAGAKLGGHAVKMIGWGVENGTPYWICVNSWNSDWGEKGLFRIIRGVDECGIEMGVVGGIPKV